MHAEFEMIAGVVRVFLPGKTYGDKYEWSATIRYLDSETVEILGIVRAPTISEWRAVERCCKQNKVKRVMFYRIGKDGSKKKHTREL